MTPQDSAREESRNLLESLSDDLFMLDSEQCQLLADKITKAIILSHQRGFKEGADKHRCCYAVTGVRDMDDKSMCPIHKRQLSVSP